MAVRGSSFASFNLLNLQMPGRPVYQDADGWDLEMFDRKIAWSSAVLSRRSADVIGFQELWSEEALVQLLQSARLVDTHQAVVPPGHRGGRIVCAVAVRADMLAGTPEWITAFPEETMLQSTGDDPQQQAIEVRLSSFYRPVLHLQVRPSSTTPVIHVFVCHVKSRRPAQVWREREWYVREVHSPHAAALGYALSTILRTAEATALRILITRITRGSNVPVVVIGDMHDGKSSNTLYSLTEQPRYPTPQSQGGGDNALYTAQTLQEYRSTRNVCYTYIFKKQRESLEHILFSEQFHDQSRDRLWAFDEMIVENDHLNQDDHTLSGTTDHGVIRASFHWKPPPGAIWS